MANFKTERKKQMKKEDMLKKPFDTEPMPYIAILGPLITLYMFTCDLLRKIAKTNDMDPVDYINTINDDNKDVIEDAQYVIEHHMKDEVKKAVQGQIDTYAGGIFKESKDFMETCKKTGNIDIASQILDLFEKNQDKMSTNDMFDTMKEIKETLEEERVDKLVDEDFKVLNPDIDLKN